MAGEHAIIDLGGWLETPAGRCMLAWEQALLDKAVADCFGFHALQLGLPEMDGLRTNRMPHRWLACEHDDGVAVLTIEPVSDCAASVLPTGGATLRCQPEALPFPDESLDLVVLPHTLELVDDPHLALAEAARVLRPEGRLIVSGFNPASLWMLRQRLGHLLRHASLGHGPLFLPDTGEAIGYWRLRDWMRLVHLEPERGRFGCYRMPCRSPAWLQRWRWMESVGERWWPVLGAVYLLQAVKRVRGMRLVGLSPRRRTRLAATPAVATQRQLRGSARDNCQDD